MKILYDNVLDYFNSLIATSEHSNYPVTNLTNLYGRSRTALAPFKATQIDSSITCELVESHYVNSIAIMVHNLASIQIILKDASDVTLLDTTLTGDEFVYDLSKVIGIHYFNDTYLVKTIQLNLIGVISPVYIGNLYIGRSIDFPRPDVGVEIPVSVTGNNDKTMQGVVSGRTGVLLEAFNVKYSLLSISDKESLDLFFSFVQNNKPMFIDRYESAESVPILFGNLTTKNFVYAKQGGRWLFSNVNLSFEECK